MTPESNACFAATEETGDLDRELQEFSHAVGLVCALEKGGKISSEQAYERVRNLWKQLKEEHKRVQKSQVA